MLPTCKAKKTFNSLLLAFLFLTTTNVLKAQSDNFQIANKYETLLDRLDIKTQNDPVLGFNNFKPIAKKTVTERIQYLDSIGGLKNNHLNLTPIDKINMANLLQANVEWTSGKNYAPLNKKPLLKVFFTNPAHLYTVNTPNFYMTVDPLLNLQIGKSNDGVGTNYINSRGVILRGNLSKKLGFYTYVTDNQEMDPLYVQEYVAAHSAVPGAGYYQSFGKNNRGYDYFDFGGGITFSALKFLNFQFVFDKIKIGNGLRSLLLSDFSTKYTYFRANAKIWKLDYEMVIAQTIQSTGKPLVGSQLLPYNYMAMHHLSWQVTRWLQLGFYENIMEPGKNGLQLSYLNPVIFYRAVESNIGSGGKANVGFEAKANIGKKAQVYGQLLINEFSIKHIKQYGQGWWDNKHAFQLGAKYLDIFGIKNLDVQVEANLVRPFTYTHRDSLTNFTHYNQPLALPMGASVKEFIALFRYQPTPKWQLSATIDYYKKGLDSAGLNFGGDVFRSYTSRVRDNNLFVGSGTPVTSTTLSFQASYELYDNLFLDFQSTYRTYNIQSLPKSSVFFYSFGIRMNMARRSFNF